MLTITEVPVIKYSEVIELADEYEIERGPMDEAVDRAGYSFGMNALTLIPVSSFLHAIAQSTAIRDARREELDTALRTFVQETGRLSDRVYIDLEN